MLVSNDYINKKNVVSVTETATLQTVKDKLIASGYRCIPVLDELGEKYLGNVYKVDLLKYEQDHGLDAGVRAILCDQENGSILEDTPFFKVFHLIKQLPYIAIIDEAQHFLGILTNGNLIQVLEDAWGVDEGGYSLTIGTIEYSGALQSMLEIVNNTSNVQGVITLKNKLNYVRRVCVVLPRETTEDMIEEITTELEDANFSVIHIEKLNYDHS